LYQFLLGIHDVIQLCNVHLLTFVRGVYCLYFFRPKIYYVLTLYISSFPRFISRFGFFSSPNSGSFTRVFFLACSPWPTSLVTRPWPRLTTGLLHLLFKNFNKVNTFHVNFSNIISSCITNLLKKNTQFCFAYFFSNFLAVRLVGVRFSVSPEISTYFHRLVENLVPSFAYSSLNFPAGFSY
jgi:hypothetical protein